MANDSDIDRLEILQGAHQEFRPDEEVAAARNRVVSQNAVSLNVSTGDNIDTIDIENARSLVVRAGGDDDTIMLRDSAAGSSGSLNGGEGHDHFDITLNASAPASRLSINGDGGEDSVLMDGQDFTICRNADGTATIKGQNGSVVKLTGIEYIQYESSTGIRAASLGDLPVGITMNIRTAVEANLADPRDMQRF